VTHVTEFFYGSAGRAAVAVPASRPYSCSEVHVHTVSRNRAVPKITWIAHTESYDTGIPTVGTRTRTQKQTSTCETISPSPSTASTIHHHVWQCGKGSITMPTASTHAGISACRPTHLDHRPLACARSLSLAHTRAHTTRRSHQHAVTPSPARFPLSPGFAAVSLRPLLSRLAIATPLTTAV
jgi:hypothetical protein